MGSEPLVQSPFFAAKEPPSGWKTALTFCKSGVLQLNVMGAALYNGDSPAVNQEGSLRHSPVFIDMVFIDYNLK